MEGCITLGRGVHLLAAVFLTAAASAAVAQPVNPSPATPQALVNKYCIACHSAKAKLAGVVLEGVDLTHPGANAPLLERALRKVRTGEMPPAGMPHPDDSDRQNLAASLAGALDREAAAHPNPGRPAIHRLNRAEYSNAIRDLLGVDIKPGEMLPVDDSGYGFDNIGDVLSVSPALLERYLSVARRRTRRGTRKSAA